VTCAHEWSPCLKGRRRVPVDQLRTSPMMCWQLFPSSHVMSMHRVSNHHSCRKRLGDQSRRDVTLWCMDKWRLGLSPERTSRAGHQLAAMRQPPASSVLELARPQTTGDTPRDLTSRSMAFQSDERPWDFDECKLTSAKNRTRRSPMLPHDTSPVSGASVMGMNIWVGQGQSHLPADVRGITATSGQGGRLRPRSRLC
jgi:hypothetical protein